MDLKGLEDRHRGTQTRYGRDYQEYSLRQQINLAPVDEV